MANEAWPNPYETPDWEKEASALADETPELDELSPRPRVWTVFAAILFDLALIAISQIAYMRTMRAMKFGG